MLVSLAAVPFYALFGISVFAARLTIVAFMLMAGTVFFLLLKRIYDEDIAFLSSLLLITSPVIVKFSRVFLSEIPSLALIIAESYFFYNYLISEKKRYMYLFSVLLIMSICSRYTSVFVVPIFICTFLILRGVNKKNMQKLGIVFVIISLCLLPLLPVVIEFSRFNLTWAFDQSLDSLNWLSKILYYPLVIWQSYLAPPALLLSLLGLCVAIYRRERTALLFVLWIIGIYVQTTVVGFKNPRYGIYLLPACCALPATLAQIRPFRLWKGLLVALILCSAGYQSALAWHDEPEYAEGYEDAARSVLALEQGESVLFNGEIDTGYFVFFVRKHAPAHALVVLQAHKMLVTSRMQGIIAERIARRGQIYELLRQFGTRYVVIEDTASSSRALQWLREELETERFILRKTIPIRSSHPQLSHVNLAIYEYREYAPPPRGQFLHMPIPLLGRDLIVPFDTLLQRTP